MEAHQQMNQNQNPQQQEEMGNNNGGCGKISTSSYLCRQSSTRWTPTTEQIKLLKELYYINGVRSPSADQIQNICARLRRYGKIEGKNVFYWFQNHKARERQKKRLTPNNIPNNAPPQYHNSTNAVARNGGLHWKQDQEFSATVQTSCKYPTISNPHGVASSSSSGQMMGGFAYGAVTMENKFRDCSISGGGALNGGNVNHNFQWGGAAGNYNPYAPPNNPPPYTNFLGKISAVDEDYDHQYHDDGAPEIETLPLFPMHNEDHQFMPQGSFSTIKSSGSDGYYYTGGYRWANGGGNASAASLELSLNSYGYGSCYSQNL